MIADQFLPMTPTVVHPTSTTDRYGNVVYDYGPAAGRTCIDALIDQTAASEPTSDGRTPIVGGWRLITNYDGIDAVDRIEWCGQTFELDGPPWPAWGFAGPHHTEARLRRVEG